MVAAIRESGCRYFRVHDSGDMFSAAYAECWLERLGSLDGATNTMPNSSNLLHQELIRRITATGLERPRCPEERKPFDVQSSSSETKLSERPPSSATASSFLMHGEDNHAFR